MNELSTYREQLPDTLVDLTEFVLVQRSTLNAYRIKLQTVNRLNDAQNIRKQTEQEMQDVAIAILAAEQRIGEILLSIEKRSGRPPENNSSGHPEKLPTKQEVASDMGYSRNQVSEYQRMAQNPDVVKGVIEEAIEQGRIPTRTQVIKEIQNRPHVANNSGNNEWYTPTEIIEAARSAMGYITLDPASCEIANRTVMAEEIFTIDDDGLAKRWFGNVWLNPPYSSDLIGKFVDKTVSEKPNYKQAIILVNNATETNWFRKLVDVSSAICFPGSRVKFYLPDGKTGTPLQGQAIFYIGENSEPFISNFSGIGWIAKVEYGSHEPDPVKTSSKMIQRSDSSSRIL